MKTDKLIDETVQASEEKYHMLFDLNRDSITIFRIDSDGNPGNFIEVNPATTTLFGYSKIELFSMSVLNLEKVSDNKRQRRIEKLQLLGKIDFETIITNKKGNQINVEIEASFINFRNEQAVMNITRDITARKQAENNIKKAQENLSTILEAIPDLLFEVGIDGKIHHYQAPREDLLAVPPSVFMGKLLQDILPPDVSKICMEAIIEADKKGWSSGKQYALDLPQGKHWFELSVSPIKESNIINKHFIILARDITERKKVEIALQENEEKLKDIFNSVTEAIYVIDKTGTFIDVNKGAEKMYQYSRKQLIGKSPFSLAAPNLNDLGEVQRKMQSVTETGIPVQFEFWAMRKNGEIFPKEVVVNKGKYFGEELLIATARDISKRKKNEEAIRKSDEKIKGIFNLANSGILLTNADGIILEFNNWWLKNLNYTSQEFSQLTNLDITHPEDLALSKQWLNKVISGKINKYQIEKRYLRKDKSFFWVEISVSAIKDINNKTINTIGIAIDITERKLAESKLRNEKIRIRTILELVGSPLFLKDNDHRITYANKAFYNLFCLTEEQVIGKTLAENVPKNEKEHFLKIDRNVLETGIPDIREEKLTVKGIEHTIITSKTRFIDAAGNKSLIGSIYDITERKITEEKLKLSSEKFQNLVNSTGGIVWEADAETLNFTFVSEQAERLLGYSAKDWQTPNFWKNHLHPDEKENTIEYCVLHTKQMKAHDFTYRFRAKDGKYIWLRDIVNVVLEEGKPKWLRGVMFDISAQKKNEESLRENEEKYRSLVENSPDGIVIYVDNKIAFINDEGLRMSGAKNKQEVIGKPVLQFIHPDSLEDVIKRMEEVGLDNNASATVELRFLDLNGVPFDVEIKAIPTIYEHKAGIQVIVHDITKRKQSALELNKINRVYALISQINNLIIRTHSQEELFQETCNIAVNFGKFRMSWIGLLEDNQKIVTAAFAGFENGYFTNSNITTIADEPEGRGPTGIAMREAKTVICNDIANDPIMKPWREDALKRGYNSSISIPIIVRNKIIGSFNLYTEETNFFSSEEEISLLEKIILNISFALEKIQIAEEQKRTEEKIRQLSQAVEQSPVSIIITNTTGEIEYANPKFVETTGYTLAEIINQNPSILKSGFTSPEEYKVLWQTLISGKEWHGEFHNKKKDGSLYWESASISPIINLEGKTTHYIAIKEDITERKNVEEELVKSKERAEESDRLKLAFLANMSHEIRTPMNGILGFTELLKGPHLTDEEQQEYIKIIEKSGKRMLNIINDIISISKVESGQIEVTLSETNVNEQIEYIHTFFKPEAKQKRIQLIISKKLSSADNLIKTDREKVYAVLTNLVKNSLKFTNEGSIDFGCERKGYYLEFFIKDTGLGISKSQKKIIFERFRQANESISRSHEGSGLGLAISKAYVEMLGGKIWVESEEGKGSTFYFTIPFHSEYNPDEKISTDKVVSNETTEIKVKDLKVLIVEDDAISKLLITIAVKPYGKEILKVSTGLEAIEACRNNPDIDLVMMDINMPKMGGYEATKQIREFNKDLIIIAQTANGMQSDRDAAIAAGCTDYISKPININSLSELIQKYFKK